MKRFALIAIGALLLVGGAQAREVAFCDPGFDIQKISGDRAVCVKDETYRDYIGNRNCPPGTNYTGNENPADGGDLCNALGGVAAVPAALCNVDPTYLGRGDVKTDMNRGARDRCYVNKTRPVPGAIRTRNE